MKLATFMLDDPDNLPKDPPTMPLSGFVYFAQFALHDLSFDRTPLAIARWIAPEDRLNHRSPSLDLDSLYGEGPEGSPHLYYLPTGRNGQPFVHVDVAGLQALAGSKLAGTVNGGETQTHTTGTSPAVTAAAIVGTFSRAVMRPFTFSVNPERTDTLTITSTPVIGAVPPPRSGETKQPTIYDLYLKFLNLTNSTTTLDESTSDFCYLGHLDRCPVQKVCDLKQRLSPLPHVPGALKSRGDCLYYIPDSYQTQYLELLRELLTAKRPAVAPPSGPVQALSVN